jgi:alcohol dehydrogenase (NADP+)
MATGDFTMPQIGLGTWQAPKGVVGKAVQEAIGAGCRLIDCAAAYGNEQEIGQALTELFQSKTIDRSEVFIVSKIFNNSHVVNGEDRPRQSLKKTLEDLQLEQLDLLLMHWPLAFLDKEVPLPLRDEKGTPNPKLQIVEEFLDTWKSMEKLKEEGLVKDIGVSNFKPEQIEQILQADLSKPVVNQVELHPYLQQPELVKYCQEKGVQLMAYSPLGSKGSYSGSSCPSDTGTTLMENPVVKTIAERHSKSWAQVLIRWSLQMGFVCIPKSANPTRIRENADMNDWELAPEEMKELTSLDREFRYSIGYIPGHFDSTNSPW